MKKFEIRIFLDGHYRVRHVSAPHAGAAIPALEEKIGTDKGYRIVSIKELLPKKLYVAYGSNLHIVQMARRCPDARIYGSGIIKDYRLAFYNVASILPQKGTDVPVGVWEISEEDEKALDRYEGFPHLYRKENIDVVMDNGKTVNAMVYIMNRSGEESGPEKHYYDTIYSGYRSFNLDTEYLESSVKNIRSNNYRFAGSR